MADLSDGEGEVRLLSASIRRRNFVSRLFAAFCWTATLILAAAAQTPLPSDTQTDAAAWGVAGSAPQTGSSAHTSGTAFKAPNGEPETGSPALPMAAPPTLPEPGAKTAAPRASRIVVVIDKPTQEMKVFVDNEERYSWKVSTGISRYDTPSGTYTARSQNEIWYSKQWDDAPMPHAIFFTRKGHAIHGTEETKKLGRPASHGCVRLAPENASTLFALVKETGLEKTEIVLNGEIPREEVKVVASHARSKQQIRPAKKTAKNKKKPSSKTTLAHSNPKKRQLVAKQRVPAKQQIKPPRFDPYAIGTPRRLSRREWLRLYYSAGPRMLPPPGYTQAPRVLPRY